MHKLFKLLSLTLLLFTIGFIPSQKANANEMNYFLLGEKVNSTWAHPSVQRYKMIYDPKEGTFYADVIVRVYVDAAETDRMEERVALFGLSVNPDNGLVVYESRFGQLHVGWINLESSRTQSIRWVDDSRIRLHFDERILPGFLQIILLIPESALQSLIIP